MIRLNILIVVIALSSKPLIGQNKISGKIQDTINKNPIQEVNIYVRSQKIGTISDADGTFEIDIENDNEVTLDISHIAYEDITIKVKPNKFVSIEMKEIFLKLDDIVVTSMKCDYALQNTPVYTEIIGENEIRESGAISISDILMQYSGMSKVYNVHGTFDYNLMGLDSKYILILKDGKPVTGKFQDKIDLDQILVTNIDKVEIIKGPGSALYGSDAIGGVINITTKKNHEKTDFGFRLRGSLDDKKVDIDEEMRSFNDMVAFNVLHSFHTFNLQVSALRNKLSNQRNHNPLNKDNIEKLNVDGKIHWESLKKTHSLGLGFEYFDQTDSGRELLSTGFELSSNKTNINRMSYMIDHNFVISKKIKFKHSLINSFYNREYDQSGIDSSYIMYNLAKEKLVDYESALEFKTLKHNLLFGYESSKPRYDNFRLKDTTHVKETSGILFQNEYLYSDNLKLIFGFRRDKYQAKVYDNPRVAAMFSFNNDYKVRISYGKGFRAPSMSETFLDFHNINQGYMVLGNQNLRPERSVGLSFNIEYSDRKKVRFNTLIYHNQFYDKILTVRENNINASPTIFRYKNISDATYRGVELFADYIFDNNMTIRFNVNARNDFDKNQNTLENSIPYSTSININYYSKFIKTKINLIQAINYRYFSRSSFYVADLLFNKKLTNKYTFHTGIKNLTNYVDMEFGPYKGRSMYVEISRQ